MYELVQEGIEPLTSDQMAAVVATLESFFKQTPEPIKVNDVVEIMQSALWSDDVPPTRLELMAGICTLRDQGKLNIEFIDSIMYVDNRL